MTSEELKDYIGKRYERWLDYAAYHCSHAAMDDEAVDVLNEVLAMLLEKYEKDPLQIAKLYEKKKGKYRELDFFILQMIKLNIVSPTSPYRHKYKPIPVDENVDLLRLDLIDEENDETDNVGEILNKVHQVRAAVDNLMLSDRAKAIFYHRFFDGESFADWPGNEEKKYLYDTYNRILNMIKDKINRSSLF